ncbi:pilin [Nocardia sp. NPDC004068]|uniref:pilin n=1 Tax=Nocardia sp. NPDC004068 TaxID=3364303 RepID=UPI003690E59A
MRVTRILDNTPRLTRGPRRRRLRWLTVLVVAAAVLVVSAASASAAPPAPSVQGEQVLAIASSLGQVLDNLRTWLIGLLAALATVCLTVAGARYLIGGGDPGELEKAKTALRAACVGYALAMLAPVIVDVLKSIVGA